MPRVSRRRILIGLLFLLATATLVSLTVGRDLYSGRSPDLGSFILVHFAGYLFFIVMPVELLVPWYLTEGHSGEVLVGLAMVTALGAQAIDYGIGRLLSDQVVHNLIGERRLQKFRGRINRYGGWTILFFNLSPLSSPAVLAVAGVVRYGVIRALGISALGLAIKYAAIVWVI